MLYINVDDKYIHFVYGTFFFKHLLTRNSIALARCIPWKFSQNRKKLKTTQSTGIRDSKSLSQMLNVWYTYLHFGWLWGHLLVNTPYVEHLDIIMYPFIYPIVVIQYNQNHSFRLPENDNSSLVVYDMCINRISLVLCTIYWIRCLNKYA